MTATPAICPVGPAVTRLDVGAYTIATDAPESDGTIAWDATTIVVVEAIAGDECGLGYAYDDASAAQLIEHMLGAVVEGRHAMAVPGAWQAMVRAVRNIGRPGIASSADRDVLVGVTFVGPRSPTSCMPPLSRSSGRSRCRDWCTRSLHSDPQRAAAEVHRSLRPLGA